MAKVRKYFCCTDNLTGCKIIGGFGIALNVIWLFISLIASWKMIMGWGYVQTVQTMAIYAITIFGLKSLSYIFLIIAACKRNATLLMVFIILIGLIDILLSLCGVAMSTFPSLYGHVVWGSSVFIRSLVSIGLCVWAQLIAIGAREEVKSYANIAWTWIPIPGMIPPGENKQNFFFKCLWICSSRLKYMNKKD